MHSKKVKTFSRSPPGFEGYFSIFVGISKTNGTPYLKNIHEDPTIQRSDRRSHVRRNAA